MDLYDRLSLLHPALAIIVVYPLIGIVVNRALLTRRRRLEVRGGAKSKIAPSVGPDHVAIGTWLSIGVVVSALLGMGFPIFSKFLKNNTLTAEPLRVGLVTLFFLLAAGSFFLLLRSRAKLGRGIFASLTGMSLILIGFQPEVFRRDDEWMFSHYYYGVAAALLMIFSVAIVQDIYQDRQNRWRLAHIALNCFALLLFMGQGMTGARDLLEIPLDWQKPYIYQCNFGERTCPQAPAEGQ
ncbi:MAG: DUF4079 family protein [Cyanobacteria bacterium RI_101]|nr:DUF4079 family protein [Cyanobacteria bacterium RI_101]